MLAGESQVNRLNIEKRVQVIAALVEGTSINSMVRMAGVSKVTILRLLEGMGCACAAYHRRHVRGLRARRIQRDEFWQFIGARRKMSLLQSKIPPGIVELF